MHVKECIFEIIILKSILKAVLHWNSKIWLKNIKSYQDFDYFEHKNVNFTITKKTKQLLYMTKDKILNIRFSDDMIHMKEFFTHAYKISRPLY